MNWCAREGIKPEDVDDDAVQRFATWLVARTLHPRPRDRIRGVPAIWHEARAQVEGWRSESSN
jgi:hypothetical protein